MNVLVDSDILIEISRGRNPTVISTWRELQNHSTAILYSPVSAAEIWAGARPPEFESTTKLFHALHCVSVDHATGELAGEFMRRFSKSHALETPDALIAAAACLTRSALWTRNRKHYPMKQLSFY